MDVKKAAVVTAGVASVFVPGLGIFGPATAILAAMGNSQSDIKEAEKGSLEKLKEEAKKQHILMEFQAQQAKVAQEVAIAHRIGVSTEVEIEEFYDTSGKGNLGVKVDPTSFDVGLGGEGRRVTKRVIKFKGWSVPHESDALDALTKLVASGISDSSTVQVAQSA